MLGLGSHAEAAEHMSGEDSQRPIRSSRAATGSDLFGDLNLNCPDRDKHLLSQHVGRHLRA